MKGILTDFNGLRNVCIKRDGVCANRYFTYTYFFEPCLC